MSKKKIKKLLETMGPAERVNRLRISDYIVKHPDEFPLLLELVFETSYKTHYKAAWILEYVLEKEFEWLFPHLDYFTTNIRKLTHHSAIRPVAKICKWIAISYNKKESLFLINNLSNSQINQIIETCFDWMIGNHKVATEAYTMQTLYFFGKTTNSDFEWVHTELKNIILQNINSKSLAYKAQGKMILGMLQ